MGNKGGMMPEDAFVKTIKTLMSLPADQVKAKMGDLGKMCICGTCPTYNATPCAKNAGEGLFCAHGTSFHCISQNKGCVCPNCPVTKAIGLKYNAFCLMGSEKAQRFDAMLK